MILSENEWIAYTTQNQNSKVNMLCFPHAGASANIFASWGEYLPEDFSLYPILYPMRENHMDESMPKSINELAYNLVYNNPQLFDASFVLYGHCMGALIAYEVALKAKELYNKTPNLIVVSGAYAPDEWTGDSLDDTLTDFQCAERFAQLNLIPMELAQNEDYVSFFIPVLRADFNLQQTYVPSIIEKIPCKILLPYGDDDTTFDSKSLTSWSRFGKNTESKEFHGGHFFMNKNKSDLLNWIYKNTLMEG